jgi:hypothetical protein
MKLEKWFSEMASILPVPDTYAKNERGYFYSARCGEKNLSVFQNSFFFPESLSENRWSSWEKMVLIFGESGFGGGKVVFGPPWGGKWY